MIWLLLAALLWGPSFGLIPILLGEPGMNANSLAFLRLVYSLVLFLPLLRVRVIARRKRVALIGVGAIQFGMMYVLLNLAYGYLRNYEVAMLTVFTPIYVTLFDAVFLRKPPPVVSMGCVLLAVAGAGVIQFARPESPGFWTGFGIMQASNLAFSFGQVAYKRMLPGLKRFGDMHVFGWMYLGAVLTAGLAWVCWENPLPVLAELRNMSTRGWLILLWLGLVPSGLGFFLFNHGALEVDTATLSIFNNLKIPLAAIIVMVFFAGWTYIEHWPRFLAGSALMLAALILNERFKPSSPAPSS